MPEMYPEFFRRVTGKEILPYQARYGEKPFASALVIVPTGLGKTDAVLMPWLYAQAYGDTAAPRRLILVLPRQNLTAQTARNAEKRVAAAGLRDQVQVLELMAGSKDNKEDLAPDRKAIIVCTQDMYFSRALNRGYARRPPRWPWTKRRHRVRPRAPGGSSAWVVTAQTPSVERSRTREGVTCVVRWSSIGLAG